MPVAQPVVLLFPTRDEAAPSATSFAAHPGDVRRPPRRRARRRRRLDATTAPPRPRRPGPHVVQPAAAGARRRGADRPRQARCVRSGRSRVLRCRRRVRPRGARAPGRRRSSTARPTTCRLALRRHHRADAPAPALREPRADRSRGGARPAPGHRRPERLPRAFLRRGRTTRPRSIHDYNYAQVLTLDLVRKGFRYAEVPISYSFRTRAARSCGWCRTSGTWCRRCGESYGPRAVRMQRSHGRRSEGARLLAHRFRSEVLVEGKTATYLVVPARVADAARPEEAPAGAGHSGVSHLSNDGRGLRQPVLRSPEP